MADSDSDNFPNSSYSVGAEGDFDDAPMFLVPGGRYVVLLEHRQVSVADLHAEADEGEGAIVCRYETDRPLNVPEGCMWVAEDGMKVYILHQYTSPITERVRA